MNPVLEAIFNRRSVRKYTDAPVSKEDMETILQAGRMAPSAWDYQACRFLVLTNKDYILRLAEVTARHIEGTVEDHHFFGARSLILVYGKRDNFDLHYDTGTAMENMFLAAYSLGLGSVWVNQLITITEEPDVMDLLEEMGIPRDCSVSAIGVFGYADEEPEAPPRKSHYTYLE